MQDVIGDEPGGLMACSPEIYSQMMKGFPVTVRAKFQLHSITSHSWGSGKTLKFGAIYDTSTEDNKRFCKATPSGTFEMMVDNQDALDKFELGKFYYVDFTPAD